MGDPLKKVQPGQPLRIPAQTFNTFIDAARDYLGHRQSQGGSPLTERPLSGVVRVKNSSGEDRGRFEILGIDAPVIAPADNEEEFKNAVALKGVTPAADHVGRFVVLQEPLKDGAIGRGMAQGVTQVRVRVDEGQEGLWFADICADEGEECLYLVPAARGAACVLWMADQDPELGEGEPDIRWALVRLSNAAGEAVRGAIVRERYDVDGHLIPDDDTFRSTFVHYVIAQVCELGTGLGPGAFVTLKATAGAAVMQQRVLAVPEGWPPATVVDAGFSRIQVDDVVGWVPGDATETVVYGVGAAVVDGYIVAHTGANGAVPTVLIQDHFWARLLTNEGGGEYTFSEIMQDGDPRTGTAVELNGTDNLPAGAGDTGAAVRIFMTYDGALLFSASSVEADVVGAEGIAVTVPAPGQWKVSVDLSSDPAFPGLEFDGSGESATLKAKVDDARGLAIDGDGIYVMIDDGEDGLLFDGGTIKVKVKADSGLVLDEDGLAVLPNGDAGIEV
ncbi:MAG: hypothetical protein IMZ66_09730, partial [Planctomycetes bacterium]|nr:hypothetical protein [Planctomycetota bacterium]